MKSTDYTDIHQFLNPSNLRNLWIENFVVFKNLLEQS